MKYELMQEVVGIQPGTIYELTPNGWYVNDNRCLDWLQEFFNMQMTQPQQSFLRPVVDVLPVAENGLNSLQNAHKKEILKLANKKINAKYIAGALEHQTNLKDDTTEDQLIEFMLEEAIDQVVYVLTLMQKRGLV